jgi:hypothetical protein
MFAPMGKFYCGEALCKTAVTVPTGASPPWPIRCPACGTALYPTDVLDRLPASELEPKRAELLTERGGRRVAVASRELDASRPAFASAPRSKSAHAPADDADRILAMVDLGPPMPDVVPPRANVMGPQRLNYYTLLIFGPILILTGVMGLIGPSPGGLMSNAVPYDVFHIVFGALGLGVALSKRPAPIRAFNVGFGLLDLYQAAASFAGLFPAQYFQWRRGDDVLHVVIGAALVAIGALGR